MIMIKIKPNSRPEIFLPVNGSARNGPRNINGKEDGRPANLKRLTKYPEKSTRPAKTFNKLVFSQPQQFESLYSL